MQGIAAFTVCGWTLRQRRMLTINGCLTGLSPPYCLSYHPLSVSQTICSALGRVHGGIGVLCSSCSALRQLPSSQWEYR